MPEGWGIDGREKDERTGTYLPCKPQFCPLLNA